MDTFANNNTILLNSVLLIEWTKGYTGIERAYNGTVSLKDNRVEFNGPINKHIDLVEIQNLSMGYKVVSYEFNSNGYKNMVSVAAANDLNNPNEDAKILITFLMNDNILKKLIQIWLAY